jgi:hypothetical protein
MSKEQEKTSSMKTPDLDADKMTKDELIFANTEKIVVSLDMMRKDYNKIIYALIAIVAANIGLKFAGTPWYVDVGIYVSLVSGIFSCILVIVSKKYLSLRNFIIRLSFSLIIFGQGIAQIILFNKASTLSGGPAMAAYDIIISIICVLLMAFFWRDHRKQGDNKRAKL